MRHYFNFQSCNGLKALPQQLTRFSSGRRDAMNNVCTFVLSVVTAYFKSFSVKLET